MEIQYFEKASGCSSAYSISVRGLNFFQALLQFLSSYTVLIFRNISLFRLPSGENNSLNNKTNKGTIIKGINYWQGLLVMRWGGK